MCFTFDVHCAASSSLARCTTAERHRDMDEDKVFERMFKRMERRLH
jgi:hypothetical protein